VGHMANVFLFAPQNFHNIGLFSRSLEYFGQTECYVYDPHRIVREHYGKYRRRELRVTSRGAFETIRWVHVEDPKQFFDTPPGRPVATVAGADALPLASFQFAQSDIIVLGSESHGLPLEVVTACTARVTIPGQGKTESLNLAVAGSILLYEYRRQMKGAAAPGGE